MSFWDWRTAVHTKATAKNTKIIADEITRPRREAEAQAKAVRAAERAADWDRWKEARHDARTAADVAYFAEVLRKAEAKAAEEAK